ncbi:MAG: trypsin-like peptidase domain-containing protein [Syntrophomonadaceae bacterium]
MKRTTIITVALVAIIAFLGGGWYNSTHASNQNALQAAVGQQDTTAAARQLSLNSSYNMADIVEQVGPAVVYIEATSNSALQDPRFRFYGFSFPQQTQQATGTGFIIEANGYILTNQHVVDGASQVTVKVQGHDSGYPATVVGEDRDLDLAVLKIEADNLPTLTLGDSDLMRSGDPVIAIGNPLGLDHTVTTGVVSAKGRPITVEDRDYTNLIQTDAAINSGNSGGPLINMAGQAIAINTAVSTQGQGIGFAIPINTAKEKMQELINTGKVTHPFLGVGMTELTSDLRSQLSIGSDVQGVVIANVESGSAASSAGLKVQDVLTAIDGQAMAKPADIQSYIQKQAVGQKLQINILRGGQNLTLTATLGAKS